MTKKKRSMSEIFFGIFFFLISVYNFMFIWSLPNVIMGVGTLLISAIILGREFSK